MMMYHHSTTTAIALLVLVCLPHGAQGRNRDHHNDAEKTWDAGHVAWDESIEAFVPYPKEVLTHLEEQYRLHPMPVVLDITASVSDFEEESHPIFALVKGMVYRMQRQVVASPHFFVQDGISAHCRDSDSASQMEFEIQGAANCTQHCTNHGRYCLGPEFQHDVYNQHNGSQLIYEATRRMCFEYILKDGNSVVLFDYLESFEHRNCSEAENLHHCSIDVLDQMHSLPLDDIEACIADAGGFDADDVNLALDEELDRQMALHITHTNQLPVLEMDGTPYTGQFTVKDMFAQICREWPEGHEMPLACQFCRPCDDVRKCLWHLECDGRPFNASDYVSPEEALKGILLADEKEREAKKSKGFLSMGGVVGRWEVGFVWGAVAGLIVAALFAMREIRIRNLVGQLADARDSEEDFKPQGAGGMSDRDIDAIMESLDVKSTDRDAAIRRSSGSTDTDDSEELAAHLPPMV